MRNAFRLPGYGGAALFVGCQAVAARTPSTPDPEVAFDVGLLRPDRFVQYLNRPTEPAFVDRFAQFLFSAAADFHPENSLATFSDSRMGLTVAVTSSTSGQVEIELSIVEDSAAAVIETDWLSFDTSRVALASGAESIRCLDGSSAVLDLGLWC